MHNNIWDDLHAAAMLLEKRSVDWYEIYDEAEREAFLHSHTLILSILYDHFPDHTPNRDAKLKEFGSAGYFDRREAYIDRECHYWMYFLGPGWVYGKDQEEIYEWADKISSYAPEPSENHGPYEKVEHDDEEFWGF